MAGCIASSHTTCKPQLTLACVSRRLVLDGRLERIHDAQLAQRGNAQALDSTGQAIGGAAPAMCKENAVGTSGQRGNAQALDRTRQAVSGAAPAGQYRMQS